MHWWNDGNYFGEQEVQRGAPLVRFLQKHSLNRVYEMTVCVCVSVLLKYSWVKMQIQPNEQIYFEIRNCFSKDLNAFLSEKDFKLMETER